VLVENRRVLAEQVAECAVQLYRQPLPSVVEDHAQLLFVNAVAVALGGLKTPAVEACLRTESRTSWPVCSVPGLRQELDPWMAAVVLGVAGHVDDFDDTHLATVIHPSTPVYSALLPAVALGAPTRSFLRAFAVGCEMQLRIGLAMTPSHYDRGWHITGTCGTLGAAVAAALSFEASRSQFARAIEIAACFPLGQREAFGTMTKSLHVGKAGANGLLATTLAMQLTAKPEGLLESEGAFFSAFADTWDPAVVLTDIVKTWHLLDVAVKPYPCGVVSHPLIDAGRLLREGGIDPTKVSAIRVHCHPLVPELMAIARPRQELEARFSARHALAAAICDPFVGREAFSQSRIERADIVELRRRIELVPTEGCGRDAVVLRVVFVNGEVREVRVDQSRGSPGRHLTRAEVFEKCAHLVGAEESVPFFERLSHLAQEASGAEVARALGEQKAICP
jgi:2-methylcitrate dehydratase PrpD